MIDFEGIKETISTGLSEYLNCPVIRSNQNAEPPKYPYCVYTITTPIKENKGTYGKYADGIDRIPTNTIISLTVLSNDSTESLTLANKAHEWLNHVGTVYLNDNGVIVQSVGSITDRDNYLTVEYEYRNGFDFVLWVMNEVEDTTATIGYIETAETQETEYKK